MKKFLCYDTNDAASGKINVSANGVLKPNSTVPSTNGATNQQLVTSGDGSVKWEDRLAYDDSRVVVDVEFGEGIYMRWVRVFDEVPSFVFDGAHVKIWDTNGDAVVTISASVEVAGNETLSANGESVIIVLSDNGSVDTTIGAPLVFPKKGVYFLEFDEEGVHHYVAGFSSEDSDTPEITWDGNIEFPKTIDPKFIPSELNEIILPSSTSGSTKKFKITVNDSGAITATEV